MLQFALSADQALELYRVLAAIKLLIEELKHLHRLLSDTDLGEMKDRYFAI